MIFWKYESPIGLLIPEEDDGGLTALHLPGDQVDALTEKRCCLTPLLKQTCRELDEYFAGVRKSFTIPLTPQGTPFQQKVWRELCRIPYGETITYGELARRIGTPKAAQAVGQANHNNPVAIIIPCHRVNGRNEKLTGYGGGLEIKQYLLRLEKNLLL